VDWSEKEVPSDKTAELCPAVHMALQAAGLALPSPPPQSAQFPSPESAIPDVMAILDTMPLAWTTDKLIPRARTTPRIRLRSRRENQRFIAFQTWQKASPTTSWLAGM
jgi:hypothetical protein